MKKYGLLFITLILLNPVFALADNDLRTKLHKASQNYLSSHFMNGSYMFCDDSGVIEEGAKGIFSFDTKEKLKPEQAMPIASATKTMTAAVILKLHDKNLLNLDDNVAKFLPKNSGVWKDGRVPEWANKVTIHNLLTHRSGLPEYFMAATLDITKTHPEINKDIANFAASKELAFNPGTQHQYCNTNFVLLGLIIESITSKDLATVFKTELFDPLGMNHTRLITLDEAVKYQTKPGSINYPIRYFVTPTGNAEPQFTTAVSEFIMVPYADGGLVSTTKDLITWHKALHSGKFLSDESYKLMTKKHYEVQGVPGTKNYMGYGLFITELANGDVVYHHAGKALAIRSESGYIPSKNLYYAVLSNVMPYIPKEMENQIDMNKPENQLDIAFFTNYIFNSI